MSLPSGYKWLCEEKMEVESQSNLCNICVCMYMCVFIYIYIYIYTYIVIVVCLYTAYKHIHMYVYIYIYWLRKVDACMLHARSPVRQSAPRSSDVGPARCLRDGEFAVASRSPRGVQPRRDAPMKPGYYYYYHYYY